MPWCRLRRVRPAIDRLDSHPLHRRRDLKPPMAPVRSSIRLSRLFRFPEPPLSLSPPPRFDHSYDHSYDYSQPHRPRHSPRRSAQSIAASRQAYSMQGDRQTTLTFQFVDSDDMCSHASANAGRARAHKGACVRAEPSARLGSDRSRELERTARNDPLSFGRRRH